MRKKINIQKGDKYNKLIIVSEIEKQSGPRYFNCICECGNTKKVLLNHLRRGVIKSCGCIVKTHGYYSSRTYNSWRMMKQRCYNPNNKDYKDYGARGIIVCDRWLKSFNNFINDLGERPINKTIDRIDVNGNYEPNNCKWSTSKEQVDNRRI